MIECKFAYTYVFFFFLGGGGGGGGGWFAQEHLIFIGE